MPYIQLKDVPKSYLTKTKKDRQTFKNVFNKTYERLKKQRKKDVESSSFAIAFGVLRKNKGLPFFKKREDKQKKSFINRICKMAYILATEGI